MQCLADIWSFLHAKKLHMFNQLLHMIVSKLLINVSILCPFFCLSGGVSSGIKVTSFCFMLTWNVSEINYGYSDTSSFKLVLTPSLAPVYTFQPRQILTVSY